MTETKLYDEIVAKFELINKYGTAVDEVKKTLVERKKKIAEKILGAENDIDLGEVAFTVFIENAIYDNDILTMGVELYHMVYTYHFLDDVMVLPDEIINFCNIIKPKVPKTIFFEVKGKLEEAEPGKVEQVRTNLKQSGQLDKYIEELKAITQLKNDE